MNSRRVKNSISALERDITNYEAFLSKVIKGKVDKSNAYKPGQIGPRSLRGRSVTPPASASLEIKSRSRKDNIQPLNSADHVLCEQVFENDNTTVEVRVTTKASAVGKSRKRPRASVLNTAPETDRTVAQGEIQKQSNVVFQPPVPSNFERNVQHERKSHIRSNHRPLPWALVLKDKNSPCIIHNAKSKDREGVKQENLRRNPRRPTHSFKRSNKHTVPQYSSCSSLSDDALDGQQSPNYASKSVQCCLPEIIVPDNKQNDFLPSKLPSKYNASDSVGDFSRFDPVRTLNFLVKELRGKLQKREKDDSVLRIITGIEDAVMRISSGINCEEVNQTSDIPTRDEKVTTKPYQIGFVPIKKADASHTRPVVIPAMKIMEHSLFRQFEHCFPPLHGQYTNQADLQSFKPIKPAKEIISDIQTEQTQLKLKCARLEVECDQLKKERDSLNEKISSSKEEVEGMAKKEKDYLTAISSLRTNLENMMKKTEEHASTVAELAARNALLKEENKALLPLRDAEAVLARHLEDRSKEEENHLQLHLQIMKHERDKFDILMARKNKEVEKLKQELRDIQAFASEQLMTLKSYSTTHMAANENNKGKHSSFNKESKLHSQGTEIPLLLKKAEGREIEKQPVCSSPTSSVPSSLGVYPSWQMISRISSSSLKDINKLSSKEVPELPLTEGNNIKDNQVGSDLEANKSFPFRELKSLEFKSFLVTSLSEDVTSESRSEVTTIEPKTCKELKDKVKDLFEKIKERAERGTDIFLPSPPHHYSEISEPGGMSQWSEVSDVESVQNSHCFSSSSAELNKGKFDFSTSDLSFEIKFGEVDS